MLRLYKVLIQKLPKPPLVQEYIVQGKLWAGN
jgi:hypothetical protein